tara:strand:- start:32 stop:577 length:546 start_codon:yes stop_codon:yes gene_type:complete
MASPEKDFPKQEPPQTPSETRLSEKIHVVQDLDANIKPYHYYSLLSGKSVAGDEPENWDIAFSKTTIIINSQKVRSEPVKVQIINQPFDKIEKAPALGYSVDSENNRVIAGGSGNSWYLYDMKFHSITPIRDRTILVRFNEKQFAKIEILSYYKGAPEEIPTEESSYFTFRYVLSNENGQF